MGRLDGKKQVYDELANILECFISKKTLLLYIS